ncbi:MAG: acyl-CoA dehydrogenase family protein [Acidimicrobiales bacterium]
MTDEIRSDDEIRGEVRRWLAENWDRSCSDPLPFAEPDPAYVGWLRRVLEARWAVPRWPVEWYGRGSSDREAKIIETEFENVGAPGAGQDRTNLIANTVMAFGRDDLRSDVLAELLCGEIRTCLLYSETEAGSDLAAVRTRAELNDDTWTVTGHKIWTSGAAHAEYGLLLARTDWDLPKHAGLSFFFCPMGGDGIEVRPIHQITGESHFNEVFLDRVEIPARNLLGERNGGWKVLLTALAYERSVLGEGGGSRTSEEGDPATDLIAFAREHGRLGDPLIRQAIARALGYRRLNELNMARAGADLAQGTSSPLMSLGKLAMSRILHTEAAVRTEILGSSGIFDGPEHRDAADVNYRAFDAYVTSIGGGTDQIQRNIISERVLGLPREPEVDRDIPFREVKSGQ